MTLALSVAAVVAGALLLDLSRGRVASWRGSGRERRGREPRMEWDPGRERRAEQRARELLRSCVDEQEWAMYRDLGFLRVWGRSADGPGIGLDPGGAPYAYLIYPHKPLVCYLPQTGTLVSEYCVEFPDESRPYGSTRLPASDDVLAKWMALTGAERRLVESANMHLPGRQFDPLAVRRDLARLAAWERSRLSAGLG